MTRPLPRDERPVRAAALLLTGACIAWVAGCAGPGDAGRLRPADFRALHAPQPAPALEAAPEPDPPLDPEPVPEGRIASMVASGPQAAPGEGSGNIVPIQLGDEGTLSMSVSGAAGAAPQSPVQPDSDVATAASPALGHPVPIDALVGHVNGSPVYASEELAPLRGKMRAALATETSRGWLNQAQGDIEEKLDRRVQGELILSEAKASLTPQQRTGLRYFLEEIQGSLVRRRGGSVQATEEELRKEGRTLSQQAQVHLDDFLIDREIEAKVDVLVNVTRRDVELRYARDRDKYQPPSTAVFRILNRPGSQADETATDLARSPEVFERLSTVYESQFRGEFTQQTHFSVEALNDAARALSPGKRAGPIELDSDRVAWVQLESLEVPEPRSLYDAQLDIEEELRRERRVRELNRYLDRLQRAGSLTSKKQMVLHLVDIAARQHIPQTSER